MADNNNNDARVSDNSSRICVCAHIHVICRDFLFHRSHAQISILLPGPVYHIDVPVRCLQPSMAAGSIFVCVCNERSSQPMLSAVVKVRASSRIRTEFSHSLFLALFHLRCHLSLSPHDVSYLLIAHTPCCCFSHSACLFRRTRDSP